MPNPSDPAAPSRYARRPRKQHVTLAARRLAGANDGPRNQGAPRCAHAEGSPTGRARLRGRGGGCGGGVTGKTGKGGEDGGGLMGGGLGRVRLLSFVGCGPPQLAGEMFPKHLQQIMDHYQTGIRSLPSNQQLRREWAGPIHLIVNGEAPPHPTPPLFTTVSP